MSQVMSLVNRWYGQCSADAEEWAHADGMHEVVEAQNRVGQRSNASLLWSVTMTIPIPASPFPSGLALIMAL